MNKLSIDELAEIKKIFNKYDVDNNGIIDWDEFCHMVDELDINITLKKKTVVFDKIDTNHTGKISFDEFIECWKE